MIEMV